MKILKKIIRYYKLLLIEALLGKDIVSEQQIWLANEYRKLL